MSGLMVKHKKIAFLAMVVLVLQTSIAVAASEKILFVRKSGKGFDDVYKSMQADLSSRYQTSEMLITRTTKDEEFKNKVETEKPGMVVLMDNQAIRMALTYNEAQTVESKKVKGVALMGLNIRAILKGNKHISGISYEIPAYTLVTQFRYVVQKPIKEVVVFYRKSVFSDTVMTAEKQLEAEGIKLHAVDVEAKGKSLSEVGSYLENNVKSYCSQAEKYDVVWILLDSFVLNQDFFQDIWLPAARESKIPFVAGAAELASKEINFAVFAMTPQLPDLASQAVQQVDLILGEHVSPGDLGVEDLIAVNKVININRAKELSLKLKEQNLKEVIRIE